LYCQSRNSRAISRRQDRRNTDEGKDAALDKLDLGVRALAKGPDGAPVSKFPAPHYEFRRVAPIARVDLGSDMMRDKADDAFAIGKRSYSPVSASPSGLSMTSMTPGYSSHAVIAGPSAFLYLPTPPSSRRV
jgi:hypothetical protein